MALPYSRNQVADKAFNMAIPDGTEESGVLFGDVLKMIDEAAMETCARVIKSSEIERLRDPAISFAVSGGVGVLPADVYVETMMPNKGGFITFARTDSTETTRQPLKYTPNYDYLRRVKYGQENDIYYTIRGNAGAPEIQVFSAAATACSGQATASACRSYTYETLPAQLANEFIDTLVEMIRDRIKVNPPMNVTTDQAKGA